MIQVGRFGYIVVGQLRIFNDPITSLMKKSDIEKTLFVIGLENQDLLNKLN